MNHVDECCESMKARTICNFAWFEEDGAKGASIVKEEKQEKEQEEWVRVESKKSTNIY